MAGVRLNRHSEEELALKAAARVFMAGHNNAAPDYRPMSRQLPTTLFLAQVRRERQIRVPGEIEGGPYGEFNDDDYCERRGGPPFALA